MDSAQSKLLALVCLGVGSIFVGLLPACFTKQSRRQWPLLLSSLLCFGGGVLLATSLVHILPEVRESAKNDYKPYVEMFFCAGFFILYLMDEIVHFFYGEVGGHSHGYGQTHVDEASGTPVGCNLDTHHGRRHSPLPRNNYGTYSSDTNERSALLREEQQPPYNPHFHRTPSNSGLFYDEPPSQLCHVSHQAPCESSIPTTNLGLLVALSIHSLLEGLVIGLEALPSKVLLLLGAVASHKLVVGFCLGVELASNTQAFCKHFICILVFSVSSVAGICLGMLISDIPSDFTDIVIPILQALAGGTLLYVTVSEVLPRERARWHQEHAKRSAGIIQFVCVATGFILMTIFSKFLADD